MRGAIRGATVLFGDGLRLIRLPLSHCERVRDYSRAGLHVEEGRPELQVQVGEQEKSHDSRVPEISLENVTFDEFRGAPNAFLLGETFRQRHHVRVVLNAGGVRAALRGGDYGAAIARPKIKMDVVTREVGHLEHLVDERLRRRHPHHVFACLTDNRLVRLGLAGNSRACRADTGRARAGGCGSARAGSISELWSLVRSFGEELT